MKIYYLLLLFFIGNDVVAQVRFQSKNLILTKWESYKIDLKTEITALNIQISENQDLKNSFIEADGVKYELQRHDEFSDFPTSQLVVFDMPINNFSVYSGNLEGNIRIGMQYVKPLEKEIRPLRTANDSCGKPAMIPISEWRKGLPAPKEAPIASKVNFVIVHHSAGSNTTTNFLEAVRNIYVFHTSSAPNGNGWNDVGYNFLIAQDGTIFEGRDGQGKFEGDNVVGAHFCGKNTNTMGICLLGNYMEIEPPKAAIKSLTQLIAWKLSKENLQNIGQSQHSGGLLNIISGHRDGCATDCPGNFTYEKLNEIRNSVGLNCAFKNRITNIENVDNQPFKVFPNPSLDYLIIDFNEINSTESEIEIFDLNGKKVEFLIDSTEENQIKISVEGFSEGTYFLKIGQRKVKFLIVQ